MNLMFKIHSVYNTKYINNKDYIFRIKKYKKIIEDIIILLNLISEKMMVVNEFLLTAVYIVIYINYIRNKIIYKYIIFIVLIHQVLTTDIKI